jgi:hypothetical protein
VIDIQRVMNELAQQRTVFHSEADFQHAFAWEIHKQLPDVAIRLEQPLQTDMNIHLDVCLRRNGSIQAVELKYKTQSLSVRIGDESFNLRDHGAQDCGRYDFIKDIQRLEQVVANQKVAAGYAVLLTNESLYWVPAHSKMSIDSGFRLDEGRVLRGRMDWTADAADGSKRTRETPLALNGEYVTRWCDYSQPDREHRHGTFRYLAVEVGTRTIDRMSSVC